MFRCRFDVRRLEGDLAAQQVLLKGIESLDIADELDILVERDPIARRLLSDLEWPKIDKVQTAGPGGADAKPDHTTLHQRDLKATEDQFDARRAKLAEIARKRKRLGVQAEIQRLETSIAVLKNQEKELADQVAEQAKVARWLGTRTVEIEMVMAEVKVLDIMMTEIATERERLKVELGAGSRVQLVQRADVSEM